MATAQGLGGAGPSSASGLLRPVSGLLVFALCVAAFLLGRISQQGSQLPEATPALHASAAHQQQVVSAEALWPGVLPDAVQLRHHPWC